MLRLNALKRLLGAKRLASIDGVLQRPLAPVAVSPSMFTLCVPTPDAPRPQALKAVSGAFVCPTCRAPLPTQPMNDELRCANGHRWSTREGIYDFKTPLE